MSTVKLPGSNIFDSQMQMNTVNQKYYLSLAKEFQHYPKKEHRKNGVIDHGKYKKIFMERKLTDRKYHVQNNTDVAHQDIRIYCNINQWPEL